MPPSTSAPFNYDEVCSDRVFFNLVSSNNTLEPPSPESPKSPVKSGAPALDSFPAKQHTFPGPPMIPVVETPDSKPTSDNPASSEANRQTIGEWFRIVMPKRSHNRTHPQSGVPSQTKATPRNEQPSTMAPGKRVRVSAPFSIDTGNG